jgi:hypothetical protein
MKIGKIFRAAAIIAATLALTIETHALPPCE